MIQKYVDRFMERKDAIRKQFSKKLPDSYLDVVTAVIKEISDADEYRDLDSSRIHLIDDGDYQGTLLFIIAATGYQPNDYWYVKVDYGSCSGCDTLQSILEYSSEVTEGKLDELMTLALHIVQGLKEMKES